MVNKCCVFGCKSGYLTTEKKVSSFHFPLDNPDLLVKWISFVNRRDWAPIRNSVICALHFEDKFIQEFGKRRQLRWHEKPVPSIRSEEELRRPSLIPIVSPSRKSPTKRVLQKDEWNDFQLADKICRLSDLTESRAPPGYSMYKQDNEFVVYYRMEFNDFPKVKESIKIDHLLHVKLQCDGNNVPLPSWFTHGTNATLTRFSALLNFPQYLINVREENKTVLLDELENLKYFNANGHAHIPFSSEMIRFALLLRYTSAQAYRLLVQNFSFPAMSTLSKYSRGSVDSIKVLEILREEGQISTDLILMVDEMYLQKGVQYHGGKYYGADETGNLYKGVVVIMVNGLKKSKPTVVKAIPEIEIKGSWLAEELLDCIATLSNHGFSVRGVVSDNHPSNVKAFELMREQYPGNDNFSIKHPSSMGKTYIFFDNVHLVKNIRNNLLRAKKFVFPPFSFTIDSSTLSSPGGFVAWSDLHKIRECDDMLQANLRKAPKLTSASLHPGNNKQNVKLALAIFDETTIAACKSYLPHREDMASFLCLVNTWWTIVNCRHRFSANPLANAVIPLDGKISFLQDFANWLIKWIEYNPQNFCMSKQTFKALIVTLQSQSLLVADLLSEGYEYVILGKFQSDAIERRFSQYRQMSGGRFLVGLTEVTNSEKILLLRSMLKIEIDFWEHDVAVADSKQFDRFKLAVADNTIEITGSSLSPDTEEVCYVVAGYVGKKVAHKLSCQECAELLLDEHNAGSSPYFDLLSSGGLLTPSEPIARFVSVCFSILDASDPTISCYPEVPVRQAAEYILHLFGQPLRFVCGNHQDKALRLSSRIIINI